MTYVYDDDPKEQPGIKFLGFADHSCTVSAFAAPAQSMPCWEKDTNENPVLPDDHTTKDGQCMCYTVRLLRHNHRLIFQAGAGLMWESYHAVSDNGATIGLDLGPSKTSPT